MFILGQIVLFGGTYHNIRGWLPCDGRLLPIAENTALFSLLGTTYGGDGRSTFALPKLENLGEARYLISTEGDFPQIV